MARAFNLVLLIIITLTLALSAHSLINRNNAMIFPLYTSQNETTGQNNTHRTSERSLLADHRPSTAPMSLNDDLLTNGYYSTRIGIGTPPQEFSLIIDTGSTMTYVPCTGCTHCGKHQDPSFQPELSSTYKPLKCNWNCICDENRVQCTYQRRYAEMSSSSGVLVKDMITFGNQSQLMPQLAVFGCEKVETGEIYTQRADGIMGLGRNDLSVIDQLVRKGVIGDSFSLCYGGMDIGGGAMILGEISPPPGMVFTHSDPHRSVYYNIELKEIHVDGTPLKLDPKIFDGRHGTVLDSGTTYAYLPDKAYFAFKNALIKKIKLVRQISGPDPSFKDVCFSGGGRDFSELLKAFPRVEMVFAKGTKLSLSPENYLFRHSKIRGAYCLGIFQNGNDATTLLGGIIVRNTLVTYDRGHNQIGFWKTNCSELWNRLQTPGSPVLPAIDPNQQNSSSAVVPTTGPYHIGQITFNMSINVDKPNFTELADLIAHGLKIDASQVHLLDYNSKGNKSIITWSIVPAAPGNSFSTSAAMMMITCLKDHQMQLPGRFGSYQLLEWEFQTQREVTWWQNHYIFASVMVVLVLSLSSFAIWSIWRQKRKPFGAYKPVGATIPEQELQPI